MGENMYTKKLWRSKHQQSQGLEKSYNVQTVVEYLKEKGQPMDSLGKQLLCKRRRYNRGINKKELLLDTESCPE